MRHLLAGFVPWASALGVAGAAACFDPELPEGLACTDNDDCPGAQECNEKRRCWSPGNGPEDAGADERPDGALDDASPPEGARPWEQLSPAAEPPARASHAMAADRTSGDIVLFGGRAETEPALDDTWTWDGETWVPADIDPERRPPGRRSHAMAFDRSRGRLVMFGGRDSSGNRLDDTWEWEGSSWIAMEPQSPPPAARSRHAMAYDDSRERVLLFGGLDENFEVLQDTMTWDGEAWVTLDFGENDTPPARQYHSMAYDAARGEIVLFGGYDGDFNALDDTWVFDGSSWEEATPQRRPPARVESAMAFDPAEERITVYGGENEVDAVATVYQDTWMWDGVDWEEVTFPGATPGERSRHAVAQAPVRGRLVLFGGAEFSPVYKGDTWTLLQTPE